MDIKDFEYSGGKKPDLSHKCTDISGKYKSGEIDAKYLPDNIGKLAELQNMLFAEDRYALLIIFQGMDAAGKDGVIKHVMGGLNPQGIQVHSFKEPSAEDSEHDYLWRTVKYLPERGKIGVFNRSYYEEVLVARVHDLIAGQKLPDALKNADIWKTRYRQIKDFEKYLCENGIIVLKFYLDISREEQRIRLLDRIDDKAKNWKFSEADIKERAYWDQYINYYQEVINETGTGYAPWYVIPSDKKWFSRLAISEVIIKTLEDMHLNYPVFGAEQLKVLDNYKKMLLKETN